MGFRIRQAYFLYEFLAPLRQWGDSNSPFEQKTAQPFLPFTLRLSLVDIAPERFSGPPVFRILGGCGFYRLPFPVAFGQNWSERFSSPV
jgi:hypothetical protein